MGFFSSPFEDMLSKALDYPNNSEAQNTVLSQCINMASDFGECFKICDKINSSRIHYAQAMNKALSLASSSRECKKIIDTIPSSNPLYREAQNKKARFEIQGN